MCKKENGQTAVRGTPWSRGTARSSGRDSWSRSPLWCVCTSYMVLLPKVSPCIVCAHVCLSSFCRLPGRPGLSVQLYYLHSPPPTFTFLVLCWTGWFSKPFTEGQHGNRKAHKSEHTTQWICTKWEQPCAQCPDLETRHDQSPASSPLLRKIPPLLPRDYTILTSNSIDLFDLYVHFIQME